MLVYRITGKAHSSDLSGTGAAMFGGRWNKKGTPVLYTGESKDIALLETIVHLPPLLSPKLDILTIEIPDDSVFSLDVKQLPSNWKMYPAPVILSEIGEQWIREAKFIAMKVPSSIIHTSYNYILNCRHPEYAKVKLISLQNFEFDSRLKK